MSLSNEYPSLESGIEGVEYDDIMDMDESQNKNFSCSNTQKNS